MSMRLSGSGVIDVNGDELTSLPLFHVARVSRTITVEVLRSWTSHVYIGEAAEQWGWDEGWAKLDGNHSLTASASPMMTASASVCPVPAL